MDKSQKKSSDKSTSLNLKKPNSFQRSIFGYDIHISPKEKPLEQCRIALVMMHQTNMWTRRAAKGFISSLCNSMGPHDSYPEVDVYSAEGSVEYLEKNVLRPISQRQGEYAMIVTIGTWCSKQVQRLLTLMQIELPHVFLGVKDAIEAGLVTDLSAQGQNITGISAVKQDYAQQIRILKSIKTDSKKVLIPYDPQFAHQGLLDDCNEVVQLLDSVGIEGKRAEISGGDQVADQIRGHLAGVDTILSLREVTMQAHAKEVIQLCNEEDVTLFASELASVFQGAALGFGDSGTVFGIHGAHLGKEVLVRKDANLMEVEQLTQPGVLRINPKVIGKQGLHLTPDQLNLIQNVIPLGWE